MRVRHRFPGPDVGPDRQIRPGPGFRSDPGVRSGREVCPGRWVRRRRSRDGYLMVAVLVAGSVVLTIALTSLRGTRAAIDRNRFEWRRTQFDRLLDAGRSRALTKATADETYTQEKWDLSDGTIPGGGDARFSISVDRESRPSLVTLEVRWNHPDGPIQRSAEFVLPPKSNSSPNREES